ncbi:CAP domain-containing protein [Strongyloides ratti]|uniref:CAP domain-containing protein n=1 Tax=Strongyloides ratti TaxID=34506 RepID=A0A090MY61_STRRB|nr:CAP domain-containing protein [Strongyloides ratti]CEF66624.1 CAP domain-containing protein [Strongyloides ratti]
MHIIYNVVFIILILPYLITSRRHTFIVTKIHSDQTFYYLFSGKKYNSINEVVKKIKNKHSNLVFVGAKKSKSKKNINKKKKQIIKNKGKKLKVTKSPITTINPNSVLIKTNISNADYNQLIKKFYQDTNNYRKKHQVPTLKINPFIQVFAKMCAHRLAKQDTLKNDTDKKYGENIYFSEGSAVDAVNKWYNEIKKYDYNKPEAFSQARHFTALVWKSTTEMGCGLAQGTQKNRFYVCCKYAKPGNVIGEFKENVLPPKY